DRWCCHGAHERWNASDCAAHPCRAWSRCRPLPRQEPRRRAVPAVSNFDRTGADVTPAELEDALAFGREQAGVEFKPPSARTDRAAFAQVTKAVLAMANKRDGGRVVIGVAEVEKRLVRGGVTPAQAESWLTHDHVADALAEYADPPVELRCV